MKIRTIIAIVLIVLNFAAVLIGMIFPNIFSFSSDDHSWFWLRPTCVIIFLVELFCMGIWAYNILWPDKPGETMKLKTMKEIRHCLEVLKAYKKAGK